MKNMKNMKKIKIIIITILLTFGINTSLISQAQGPVKAPITKSASATQSNPAISVKPLELVNNPTKYLNKKITMQTKFDKFSTLGLDYKPAFMSSEKYISFLVKRDDTLHDIPLSELKLFLDRQTAEKFINLKTGDEINITAVVFSNALGDVWAEVLELKQLK